MIEINEATRRMVAKQLAAQQHIPIDEATGRVDDVCQREKESPHVREVAAALGAVARPILDMIEVANESGDPHSEAAVARVVGALESGS